MNRFQFVWDHKDAYGVKRLCEVIEIARSSFYAWLAAAPGRAAKAAEDAALAARIRKVQDPAQGGDRAYGAPRVTAELNDGVAPEDRVNRKRVARVMRQHRLAGIRLRKRVKTTLPDQSGRRFPDLLARDFSTGEHGRARPPLRRRHHLPAHRGRHEPLPRVLYRPRLPQARRVGDGRPHAHRTRRGRTEGRMA